MRCPKCQSEMSYENRHGVTLASCSDCAGAFLPSAAFVATATEEPRAALARALRDVEATRPTDIHCPTGDLGMLEAFDLHGIEIDRCPTCVGLFFDRGELQALFRRKPQRKVDKVEWKQSPRLTAKGVASVTLLPDLILRGLWEMLQ